MEVYVKKKRAQTNEDYETWEQGEVTPTLNVMDNTAEAYATVLQTSQTSVRRLLPVECERLQGFPDDWTAGQPDSTRYRQMGNAVAVPVVEWIIGRIMEVEGERA